MADLFEYEGEIGIVDQDGGYAYSAIELGCQGILESKLENAQFFKPGVRYRITIESLPDNRE